MNKQELQQEVLKVIQNERELTIILMTEFVEERINGTNFTERLNLLFGNTNSMIESKFERLEE